MWMKMIIWWCNLVWGGPQFVTEFVSRFPFVSLLIRCLWKLWFHRTMLIITTKNINRLSYRSFLSLIFTNLNSNHWFLLQEIIKLFTSISHSLRNAQIRFLVSKTLACHRKSYAHLSGRKTIFYNVI